jgi:L-ascorbate metabolism protein UlaG (beta-lactamase superfamily)
MDVGEAVRIAVAAGAHTLVPIHWDLFRGNTVPPGNAVEEAVALGAPLHVLTVCRMVPFSLPSRP